MDSFFFIPGDKLLNINKIRSLGVDEIIIDLEDAVKASERDFILTQLISNNEFYKEFYIRIPLYHSSTRKVDNQILLLLLKNGFRKFVFPKVVSSDDFILLEEDFREFYPKIILLIETPRLLLEAKDLLLKYRDCFSGIAVGSHDFISLVGGIHTLQNLEFLRLQILYLARMIDILAIDIASMELQDTESLAIEIMDGVYKGFDAKMYIHPKQIEVLRSMKLYTTEEQIWACKVKDAFGYVQENEEFIPVVIDGKVIEKPHLKRAEKILNHFRNEDV